MSTEDDIARVHEITAKLAGPRTVWIFESDESGFTSFKICASRERAIDCAVEALKHFTQLDSSASLVIDSLRNSGGCSFNNNTVFYRVFQTEVLT